MDGFNERTQGLLFDPSHLARTEPVSSSPRTGHFPAYKIGAEYPALPASFSLERRRRRRATAPLLARGARAPTP